ncbi:universal stress protein [bacterium]|nr:universal stress protein [bacterium]
MSFKLRPEKIMVYVEATEKSIIAAYYAVCLAKWLNASLIAAYVVDIKTLKNLTKAKIFIELEEMDYEHDLEEDGKRYLNHVKELADNKNIGIEKFLLKGEVFKEVLNTVKENDVDLLIMGELEEPESRRDFYYNETELIFRKSPCPVLVVKEDNSAKTMYDNL